MYQMLRAKGLIICSFLAIFLLFALSAMASEPVGKVSSLEGVVDVLRGGQLPAIAVKVGDPVFEKDVIRTKSNGKAEVTFNDGNVIRVAPSSRIDISEYNAKEGSNKAVITLPRGKIQSVVNKDIAKSIAVSGKSTYEVRTPNAVAGVRGTDYFVFHNQNISGVAVKEGVVVAQNPKFPDIVVVVTAGQMTSIPENKPPAPPQQVSNSLFDAYQKNVTPDKEKQDDTKDEKVDAKKDDTAGQKQAGPDKQAESSAFAQTSQQSTDTDKNLPQQPQQTPSETTSSQPTQTSTAQGNLPTRPSPPSLLNVTTLSANMPLSTAPIQSAPVIQQVVQNSIQQIQQSTLQLVTDTQQSQQSSTLTNLPTIAFTASKPADATSILGNIAIVPSLTVTAKTDASGKWVTGSVPLNFKATFEGTSASPSLGDTLQTAVASTNPDGSSTYGLLVGAMHSWDGFLTMLYRDAQRNIGFLTGSLSGTTSSTGLSGTGSGTVQIMGSTTDTRPLGEILKSYEHWGNLVINVGGQSSVFGNNIPPDTGVLLTGLGNLSIFAGTDVTGGITNRGAASGTITFHSYEPPMQPNTNPIYNRYYGVAKLQQGSLTDTAFDANYVGHALSLTDYYTLTGKVVGTPLADGTLKYAYAGQQISTPLTFASEFMGGHFYGPSIPYFLFAQFGGTGNLWATSGSSFNMIGDVHYFVDAQTPNQPLPSYNRYSWDLHFSSQNVKAQKHTTYDGGAYFGMMAGAVDTSKTTGFLTGSTYALYIDPSGNAGILKGTVAGSSLYDKLTWADTYGSGYWQPFDAVGSFQPVQIVSNTGIAANNLPVGWMFDSNYVKQNSAYYYSTSPNTKIRAYEIDSLDYPSSNAYNLNGVMGLYSFTSQPTFGIWTVPTYSTQIPTSSNRLLLTTDFSQSNFVAATAAILNQTALGFTGSAYGYLGDYESATTYVMSGNTYAMNDTFYGFTSNTVGTWLSTPLFINLLNSDASKLSSLGYPTNVIGSGLGLSSQTFNINNIKFVANSPSDLLGMWTGQSISATFPIGSTLPHYNQVLSNSDGSFLVYSLMRQPPSTASETSKWLAELWGFGATTISGSIKLIGFEGVSAGEATVASNSLSVTGTASGLFHYINYISRITEGNMPTYMLSYNKKDATTYAYEASGYLKGLFGDGGMRSLWSASKLMPANFEMIGVFVQDIGFPMPPQLEGEPTLPNTTYFASNHVFGTVIYPNNFTGASSQYSTVDGGSYWGYLSGIHKSYHTINTNLEGLVSSLYISPNLQAGLLVGGFGVGPNIFSNFDYSSKTWYTEGSWYPVELATTTLFASSLRDNIKSAVFDFENNIGSFTNSGHINATSKYTQVLNWIDSATTKDFGVWASGFYGTYSGDASQSWGIGLSNISSDKSYHMFAMVSGNADSWANDIIKGTHMGFFADTGARASTSPASHFSSPITGITVGEVIGTFNPTNLTFQTISSGVWLETNKLLQLASTEAGRTKLQDLKIPAFEVGRATLSGSGNGFSSLTMSDVVFLAPASGGRPVIWATGSVSGQYSTAPAVNQPITLSGSSVNVDFTFKHWNQTNNTWLSVVNGSGTVGSHNGVVLSGAGAGSINQSAKTISGTAAGIAK